MHLQVASATLAALLLATARGTGFVLFAPPFNNNGIPMPVKGAMALALAVVVSGRIAPGLPQISAGFLVVAAISEVAIGAALGFIVQLFFTAVQMAGDILDVAGGFSLQPAYDPLSMTTHSNIGKLQYVLASTLLFTSGGHLVIVKGFVTSYQALPIGASFPSHQLGQVMIQAISTMFLAALQIAGPLVAVLLLADVALALMSRAAPALNIFSMGFPVKIMLTLALLGLSFPLLPSALDTLISQAVRAVVSIKGG
jgi:flagellar biosynthetic protein FliR